MLNSIEILIAKYCSDKLDNDEREKLMKWIESGENREIFNDYISLNHTVEELKSQDQEDLTLWNKIESGVKTPVRKLNYWKYGAAASVLLIIAFTLFFNKDNRVEFIKTDNQIVVKNNIKIGSDKAVLTTENGENIILEKGRKYLGNDLSSDGEKIIYSEGDSFSENEIAYNYLTVPRGGQFYIELSDQTKIWLNSESKIKYPKKFFANQLREVELFYGEAYFDVSSSSNHNGVKFKVLTKGQKVEVLGTEFNIKSYLNDNFIFTTLVEGAILVGKSVNVAQLKPQQQSIVNIANKSIDVKEVDLSHEVSWRNGVFNFNGKPLDEIMKVLERWYDVDVEFETKSLEKIKCIGIFRKDQNIEYILSTIKNSNIINSYEIKNQKIILK